MKLALKIGLPIVVLIIGFFIIGKMKGNKPKSKRKPAPPAKTFVDHVIIKKKDATVNVFSQGTVEATVKSRIMSQVSGKITKTYSIFLNGKFFSVEKPLVEIEKKDFEIALKKAKAEVTKAEVKLEEEKIRVENFQTEIANAKDAVAKAVLKLEEETAQVSPPSPWARC